MSNFPNSIDNDFTLPPVNNNITEIGSEAINSLRDAVINIEEEIGASSTPQFGAKGSCSSLADRLNVSLNPDGTIKSSILLLSNVFPIYDANVANNAAIKESKLALFCDTETLYNNYLSVLSLAETSSNWIYSIGNRLQNHIYLTDEDSGTYNHFLSQIHVSDGATYPTDERLSNRFTTATVTDPASNGGFGRNNTNLFTLINDINNDYLVHQKSDGYYVPGQLYSVKTLSGKYYPSNFAHTASGLHLNTENYTVFPSTIKSIQEFADYIDLNNDLLAGKRYYNLFTSGIPRTHRSSVITPSLDGYGPPIFPVTKVTSYLLKNSGSTPQDNPINGDDVIRFTPPTDAEQLKKFNNDFSLIKVGDIARINYGFVQGFGYLETEFLVKEKKFIPSVSGSTPVYSIRIDGKNLIATTNAYIRIDRPLFNSTKGGVLSISAAQCLSLDNSSSASGVMPSLTISHPRGAVALGNDFDASAINSTNYLLYLIIYPENDINQPIELKAVDITGNFGNTPGKYTLQSIVEATNNSFRKQGFNYRFSAFSHNGNFGIMLSDSYRNTSFSIIAGELKDGQYTIDLGTSDQNFSHPKNIIQYDSNGSVVSDPLGFGKNKANIVSPHFYNSIFTKEDAFNHPKKIFLPLKRNSYYIDGAGLESDKLAIESTQSKDSYGDGYWEATLTSYDSSTGQFTYRIHKDLSSSGLAKGKTLVVQSLGYGNQSNFGRYIITDVVFNLCDDNSYDTFITIFNGMHSTGVSGAIPINLPTPSLQIGQACAIYFNSDSVGFNLQHASSNNTSTSFKRHFEIYVDKQGKTFSLERARMNISNSSIQVDPQGPFRLNADVVLSKLDLVRVSPKLRGYLYNVNNLVYIIIKNYDSSTGEFDVALGSYYNTNLSASIPNSYVGKYVHAKKGEVVRVYDLTNIDYIDFIINSDEDIPSFSEKKIAVQLFPTLAFDQEVMLLASCQVNGVTNIVNQILDLREFGNVSEKDISNSLIDYISTPERLLHSNGVFRGFDYSLASEANVFYFNLSGGVALVNGKIIQANDGRVNAPSIQELYNTLSYPIKLCLCLNEKSDYEFVAILDYDDVLLNVNAERNIQVYNYINSQGISNPYSIKSYYFNDLVNNYKNLTPLYFLKLKITGTASNPTTAIFELEDIRRFVNDESLNDDFTWSDESNTAASYFKNFNAVKNWVNLYGSNSNLVKIKKTIRLDSSNDSYDFSQFKKPVIFEGNGNNSGFNIWNPILNIGSEITFKNLNITFYNGNDLCSLDQNSNDSGCVFENVNFNTQSGTSGSLSINVNSNNKFINCQFNKLISDLEINNFNHFENCTFAKISGSNDLIIINNKNKFINCKFNELSLTATSTNLNVCLLQSKVIGDVETGSGNLFEDCEFTSGSSNNSWDGYFSQGINLNNDNIIKNCSFTTDFYFKSRFIKLLDGNIIDDLLIGTNRNNFSNWNTIIANHANEGYSAIEVSNNNLLNKIICSSIFVNKSGGSGFNIIGSNNTLSNCTFNNMFSFDSCLKVLSANKIINNNFKSLQSLKGIEIITNNITNNSLIISNNYINYISIAIDDDVPSPILGGAIYFEAKETDTTLSNVTISDCNFISSIQSNIGQFLKRSNFSANYIQPPLSFINFKHVLTTSRTNRFNLSNIKIQNCSSNWSNSANGESDLYSAISFIFTSTSQNPNPSLIPIIKNLLIENNYFNNYGGILLAGENDKTTHSAINVNISKNNARYISAYACPATARGGITIDQNNCIGIVTYNLYKSKILEMPEATENLTISSNRVQTIEVYSKSS